MQRRVRSAWNALTVFLVFGEVFFLLVFFVGYNFFRTSIPESEPFYFVPFCFFAM
jgi:hypothetical protein